MNKEKKTREEVIEAKWEDLTGEEQVMLSTLKENPDMSLEKAMELYEKLIP